MESGRTICGVRIARGSTPAERAHPRVRLRPGGVQAQLISFHTNMIHVHADAVGGRTELPGVVAWHHRLIPAIPHEAWRGDVSLSLAWPHAVGPPPPADLTARGDG